MIGERLIIHTRMENLLALPVMHVERKRESFCFGGYEKNTNNHMNNKRVREEIRTSLFGIGIDLDNAKDGYFSGIDYVTDKIMAIFAREQEEIVKENKQLDMHLDQALEERDSAEEWADKFAYTIGAKLGIDVGEHSSMNSPWVNAYEALDDLTEQIKEEK